MDRLPFRFQKQECILVQGGDEKYEVPWMFERHADDRMCYVGDFKDLQSRPMGTAQVGMARDRAGRLVMYIPEGIDYTWDVDPHPRAGEFCLVEILD